MFKEIEIGNKTVGLKANGLSVILYHRVFHEDFNDVMPKFGTDEAGATIEAMTKMAFIMAKQAEGKKLDKLNEDMFFTWLEDFEPLDLPNAMPEILGVYMSQTEGTAKAKK